MPANKYDIIVVGSGMGGLVSAVVLAKNGYKVLVLEKNQQIGGALQVFSRDKCVFDTGVHYIGGLDPGENLYRMFKYLGIYDDLRLKALDRDCFDLIRLANGKTYAHGQGYTNFINNLVQDFPEEEAAIRSFCAKIEETCKFFPLYNLEKDNEVTYYNSPDVLGLSAWDYVNSITKNKELVNVLLGSGPLYAGERSSTPFYVVALIMNSYIKGSYRLVDGGSQLAKALVKQLRAHGGEILKHKEVVGSTCDSDQNINEVHCSDGTRYTAKHFISNLHPMQTIRVFGADKFRPAYRSRISKLENSVSAFMIYASLKENSFPYINHNIYLHFVDAIWDTTDYDKEDWPQTAYFCTPASSKSPEYAESICVMCYMKSDEVKEWEDSFNIIGKPGERGERYATLKKEKEARIIDKLELHFPGIRENIKGIYSSSPLTYKDYLYSPEGSLYGVKKDFNDPARYTINTKTKIPNLFLTGQNIIFHGILGTTIGAFVTCFNFVNIEETLHEIKRYE